MKIFKLLESCKFIQAKVGNILIGVPSDILKKIGSKKNLGVPTILVQPDINHYKGIPQFAIEFPLLYFLFIGNYLFKKRFILLTKDEEHKKKEIEVLSHIIPAPPMEFFIKNGMDKKTAIGIRKEIDYLVLKKDGKILDIEDMIEFIVPDENNGYTITENENKLRINRLGNNKFEIIENDNQKSNTELVYKHELPIKINYQLPSSYICPRFGLVNLGSRSGFDPDSYTTTFIITINGVMGLLDCSAYLFDQLNQFGLSFEDIKFVLLTHIHDDHCNLSPIVYKISRTIPIITTKDIYESVVIKITNIIDEITEEDFKKQFPLIEIKAGYDKEGEVLNFYGAKIYAHRTIHSVSCIGFTIKIASKSLFFSGDTISPKKIFEYRDKKVISNKRAEYLVDKLNGDYTRALIDGGGGIIHGNPDEFQAKRGLHFVHVSPMCIENSLHNLLDAGQSLQLISAKMLNENITYHIIKILSSIGISIYDPWMKVFLNSGRLVNSQQYEFLAIEGEMDDSGFFMVLSGEVEVIVGTSRIVSHRQGSFFGELALLEEKRGIRQAGIRISSITALLWEIPAEVFQSYIKSSKRKEEFYNIRKNIKILEDMPFIKGLSGIAITKLANVSNMISFPEGSEIIINKADKKIIFLLSGQLKIIKDQKIIEEIIPIYDRGQVEEISKKIKDFKNSKIIAKNNIEIFEIAKDEYNEVLNKHKGLYSPIRSKKNTYKV